MRSLFLLVPLCLAGCANPGGFSRQDVLAGMAPEGYSADKLKSELTRSDKNWGGGFFIEAALITDGSIEVQEKETGKRNMDSQDVIRGKIAKHKSAYAGQSCFMLTLETLHIDSGYFRLYSAKLEDSKGTIHPLKFTTETGVESVPKYAPGGTYDWFNISSACLNKKVATAEGFKIHFIAPQSHVQPSVLQWNVKPDGRAIAGK